MPTRLRARAPRSLSTAARPAPAAPSATLWVSEKQARIASSASESDTRTTRSTPRRMISSASRSGVEQAMPSAICVVDGWGTTLFASNESAMPGACSEATPMIRVESPSASRAAMSAQTPEPIPIGM